MDGWAWWPSIIPRIWCRWRIWSTAAPSPITLTLFGADVGKPVEVPLDELERYASRPFGVAIAPDKSRIYVTMRRLGDA